MLPARAVYDWYLFDQIEPLGNREIRRQLAFICSTIFNRWRDKGSAPASPEDFVFKSPAEAVEHEEEKAGIKKQNMITALQALALASGPRPLRRRKAPRR